MPLPRAIPLITVDPKFLDHEDKTRFILNEDAISYLQSIDEPVCIIAIAGLYRTGKSFVMNQLAGQSHGFVVGSTVEACTRGLWLWEVDASSHLGCSYSDKLNKTRVLLLDTEGLGSLIRNAAYDVQIFSLALLLSSFFVYNSTGSIDEGALDRLSLVVQMTKYIRASAESSSSSAEASTPAPSDPSQLKMYFPQFLWLLRDFTLDLEVEGQRISSRQYLENALKPIPGDQSKSSQLAAKNEIRKIISSFFSQRDCFTMVRPVVEESDLKRINELSLDDFREQYRTQLKELKENIFSHVDLKRMHGTPLSGAMLAELASQYVEAINNDTFPTISTAWSNVVALEGQKAAQKSRDHFTQKLTELLLMKPVMEDSELLSEFSTIKRSALSIFKSKSISGEESNSVLASLESELNDKLSTLQASNRDASLQLCKKTLADVTSSLDDFVSAIGQRGSISAFEELASELNSCLNRYQRTATGPSRHEVLTEYFLPKSLDHSKRLAMLMLRKEAENGEKRMKETSEKSNREYHRLEELMEMSQKQMLTLQEQLASLTSVKNQLERRTTKQDAHMDELKRDRDEMEKKLKAAVEAKNLAEEKTKALESQKQKLMEEFRIMSADEEKMVIDKAQAIQRAVENETQMERAIRDREQMAAALKSMQDKGNGKDKDCIIS